MNIIRATSTPVYIKPDGDDVLVIIAVANCVIHLPKAVNARTGLRVIATVETVSGSGTGASLSPDADDKFQGTGLTAADNKDLINTQATEAVGDTAEVVCDNDTGWRVTNLIGTWAREA
ncbi:MAG: hypothetical protein VW547_02015 [Alphaproteobacteria bacterium]